MKVFLKIKILVIKEKKKIRYIHFFFHLFGFDIN